MCVCVCVCVCVRAQDKIFSFVRSNVTYIFMCASACMCVYMCMQENVTYGVSGML